MSVLKHLRLQEPAPEWSFGGDADADNQDEEEEEEEDEDEDEDDEYSDSSDGMIVRSPLGLAMVYPFRAIGNGPILVTADCGRR